MQFPKRTSDGLSGSYLKIKPDHSKVGVFRGELHSFRIKWENNRSSEVPEPDRGKHNRFKINFVTTDESNKVVALVWEFGVTVYDQMYDLSQEMDLSKTKIKITRRGTGTDTSYTLVPLGPADMKAIEPVKLNLLVPSTSEEITQSFADEPSFNDADEIPF